VLGNGILHIEMPDFMRQMTTMRVTNEPDPVKSAAALLKFGRYFAGALWDVYGGALRRADYFNPDTPPRSKRPLRVCAPEFHFFKTEDGLTLRLTRYQGGSKGPVILSHGLGVASSLFSADTIDTNLLEYLFERQYDVWLLDYRASIDLAYASLQYSGDDVAKYDYPAAVDTVRNVTGRDTVQFVVHCWGATTWTMAMMSGLRHVRSAVVSQVSAYAVTGWLKEVEAALYLPETMDRLGIRDLTAYTDSHADLVNRLFDKAVQLMPAGAHQGCDNPVCHRITFLYGLLYQHQQLNQALHDNLHELFGVACIKSLSHLTTIIRAGHVVDAEGRDVYMPHLDRINVPTLFISGAENRCFKPVSTEKTYEALCKLNGPQLYKRHVVPGYGHIDCMFGKNAVQDVYPHILRHLEEAASA
jgi:cholesterol oxidase